MSPRFQQGQLGPQAQSGQPQPQQQQPGQQQPNPPQQSLSQMLRGSAPQQQNRISPFGSQGPQNPNQAQMYTQRPNPAMMAGGAMTQVKYILITQYTLYVGVFISNKRLYIISYY